jgi:hypothetical protein
VARHGLPAVGLLPRNEAFLDWLRAEHAAGRRIGRSRRRARRSSGCSRWCGAPRTG